MEMYQKNKGDYDKQLKYDLFTIKTIKSARFIVGLALLARFQVTGVRELRVGLLLSQNNCTGGCSGSQDKDSRKIDEKYMFLLKFTLFYEF